MQISARRRKSCDPISSTVIHGSLGSTLSSQKKKLWSHLINRDPIASRSLCTQSTGGTSMESREANHQTCLVHSVDVDRLAVNMSGSSLLGHTAAVVLWTCGALRHHAPPGHAPAMSRLSTDRINSCKVWSSQILHTICSAVQVASASCSRLPATAVSVYGLHKHLPSGVCPGDQRVQGGGMLRNLMKNEASQDYLGAGLGESPSRGCP
jgi:hypothetical protein